MFNDKIRENSNSLERFVFFRKIFSIFLKKEKAEDFWVYSKKRIRRMLHTQFTLVLVSLVPHDSQQFSATN